MNKNNHCIDCNKLIWNKAVRCKSCSHKGKLNSNYKNGKTLIKHYCIDCYKKLNSYEAKRCNSCCQKGKLGSAFKDGRSLKKYYCQDCSKKLSNYQHKRCAGCKSKGKLNGMFKTGYTMKKHYCLDCNKRISCHSKRCNNCRAKRKDINGKNNPMFGKSNITKNTIIEHHIDLNKNNNQEQNKLILTQSIHAKLHARAYEYLVRKGMIKQYIQWFLKYKIDRKARLYLQEIK